MSNVYFYHVSTKLDKPEARTELCNDPHSILLCILKVPMRQKKNMQFSSKRIFSHNWWWHVWYCTVYFFRDNATVWNKVSKVTGDIYFIIPEQVGHFLFVTLLNIFIREDIWQRQKCMIVYHQDRTDRKCYRYIVEW